MFLIETFHVVDMYYQDNFYHLVEDETNCQYLICPIMQSFQSDST